MRQRINRPPPKPDPFSWHRWFAWYPVRVPKLRHRTGQVCDPYRVWWEPVYRQRQHSERHGWWSYCMPEDLERVLDSERVTDLQVDEFVLREPA